MKSSIENVSNTYNTSKNTLIRFKHSFAGTLDRCFIADQVASIKVTSVAFLMRFVMGDARLLEEKIYFYSREKRRRYLCSNNCIHRRLTSKRHEKNHHMHNASQTDVRCPILVTKTSCKGA